jgi:hypothetical protein
MAEPSFQPDPQVAEVAAAYALDAVDLARRNFGLALDGSEASVRQVEQMLGRLHEEMAQAQPPEDAVWTFAKAFGSYVGEVLRRHHGGEWGIVRVGEQSFPGFRQTGGALCWPWGKAHKRLVSGPEDSISHYYSVLVQGPAERGVAADRGPHGGSP